MTPTDTVPVPRALLVRAIHAIEDRLSTSGHVMQLVVEEGRGRCTVNGESEVCVEYLRLVNGLMDALGTPRQFGIYREEQPPLLGEAM